MTLADKIRGRIAELRESRAVTDAKIAELESVLSGFGVEAAGAEVSFQSPPAAAAPPAASVPAAASQSPLRDAVREKLLRHLAANGPQGFVAMEKSLGLTATQLSNGLKCPWFAKVGVSVRSPWTLTRAGMEYVSSLPPGGSASDSES